MSDAATTQKRPREYHQHGDNLRKRILSERGYHAIDARTRAGKQARAWRRFALERKGGRSAPIDVKQKIEAATFYLW